MNKPTSRAIRFSTPWGIADSITNITPDRLIVSVGTPSHGGIGVSKKLSMPDYFKNEAIESTDWFWFEEDCAWSCVPCAFPQYFDQKTIESAKTSLCNWFPDAYALHFGVSPIAQESLVVRKRELDARLNNHFRPKAGYGDWAWNVPLDHVYVVGFRASDGASQGFLLKKDDYQNTDEIILDKFQKWEPDQTLPYSKPAGYKSKQQNVEVAV